MAYSAKAPAMTFNNPVGILVLAAGESFRLGQPKQLLKYGGRSLLRRAIVTAIEAGVGPVGVVVGAHADKILPETDGLDIERIVNDRWREGMGASIAAGCRRMNGQYDLSAIILTPCDQPKITADLLRELCDARSSGYSLAACRYAGTLGIPALFDRRYFVRLEELIGTSGAKSLLKADPDKVLAIEFPGGEFDVDTAADYEKLLEAAGRPAE